MFIRVVFQLIQKISGLNMQKALERMNIKVHDVISSLTGVSGLAMVRAILARANVIPSGCWRCAISESSAPRPLKEALRGTWAEEHLFAMAAANS